MNRITNRSHSKNSAREFAEVDSISQQLPKELLMLLETHNDAIETDSSVQANGFAFPCNSHASRGGFPRSTPIQISERESADVADRWNTRLTRIALNDARERCLRRGGLARPYAFRNTLKLPEGNGAAAWRHFLVRHCNRHA